MKIRLGAFHHESLDLNGDLGNLLVLSTRLNNLGFDCDVIDLTGENIERELAKGLNFAFLGHGSKAAWLAIDKKDAHFESAILSVIDAGVDFLAVSSGFEKLIEIGAVKLQVEKIERRSEFAVFNWGELEIVGYLNSDQSLPLFYLENNIYATLLHGPLLAKNPKLADLIIEKLLKKRDVSIQHVNGLRLVRSDEYAELARAVAKSMIE